MTEYYLCDYVFEPMTDLRSSIDKLFGVPKGNVRGMLLIKAKSKEHAKTKFEAYFKEKHPDRKLKAWGILDTI